MRLFTRTAIAVVAASIATAGLIAPAQAAGAKPGASCAMSGMVMTAKNLTYVCQKSTAGKTVWSQGLKPGKAPLTIKDGWAKAADTGMSGAFGMIMNPTTKPITVIGATSPYAKAIQTHEMVMKDGAMVMSEKPGGFVIPAKGSFELKPGGNHLMFMGITKPIKAGALVPLTLITKDGATVTVKVMAKPYVGANETYDPNASTGMSMG